MIELFTLGALVLVVIELHSIAYQLNTISRALWATYSHRIPDDDEEDDPQ